MGIGLGLAAGGFVKGYETAEDIKNKRSARDAQDVATQAKRRDLENEIGLQQDLAAAPTPGKLIDIRGGDYAYDQQAQQQAAIKAAQPAQQSAAGAVISRIAGALHGRARDVTAASAGVGPPVVGLGVAPTATALAAGAGATAGTTPAPATAAPVAAAPEAAPAPVDSSLAGAPAVNPVPASSAPGAPEAHPAAPSAASLAPDVGPTDSTGKPLSLVRPADETDRQLYMAHAYGQRGMTKEANDAYKQYQTGVINRSVAAIPYATPGELGHILSRATKSQINFAPNADDPKKLDLYVGGQMSREGLSRADIQGMAMQNLGSSQEEVNNYVTASNKTEIDMILARAKQEEARAATSQAASEAGLRGAQQSASEFETGSAKDILKQDKLLDTPNSGVLYPQQADTYANDKRHQQVIKSINPMNGETSAQVVNPAANKIAAERATWMKNEWRQNRIVQRVDLGTKDSDGNEQFGFGIVSPDGKGYMPGTTTDMAQAFQAAAQQYPEGAAAAGKRLGPAIDAMMTSSGVKPKSSAGLPATRAGAAKSPPAVAASPPPASPPPAQPLRRNRPAQQQQAAEIAQSQVARRSKRSSTARIWRCCRRRTDRRAHHALSGLEMMKVASLGMVTQFQHQQAVIAAGGKPQTVH